MLALDASMQRFIVQRFAAAGLEALAAHGSSRDADLARKYVTADSEEVKKEAVRVLERFGTKEDVDRLVPLFREGYGELREVAARTALTLDPAPHGVLVSMLDTDNPMLVSLALKSISPADFMEIRSAVESLLERRNPAVRVKGISFLVERLSGGELQELLNDYMKPPYYYNVVCWLDRILFAPEPLRDAFVRQLRDQGYLSSRAW